jgi:hypothetical protein
MRLRLAPVEYKVCATDTCESKYEGSHCPRCQQPFDPEQMRKDVQDRLILVDTDPAVYELDYRCRCPECRNLFVILEQDLITRAKCQACGQPLWRREELLDIWQDAVTSLQKARKLDRARRQLQTCPHCRCAVSTMSWCPLQHVLSHADSANGLSQNPTVVWVRTYHTAESVDELRQREGADMVEQERESEVESESDTA